MNYQYATASATSYFAPSTQVDRAPDYRHGLIHDVVEAFEVFRSTLKAKSGGLKAFVGDVFTAFSPIHDSLAFDSRFEGYVSLLLSFEKLRAAPSNWSPDDPIAPSAEQYKIAEEAVISLLLSSAQPPKAMLLNDGTLGVFWRRGSTYTSIDFDADGDFPWTTARDGNIESGIWHRGEPITSDLLIAISG